MQDIDVTLISGRRPDLLERTLRSFAQGLFHNFKINRFIANIDPFAGDQYDHARCRALIRGVFPHAILIEPDEPSFGLAVKQAWLKTSAKVIFHLEDDWLLKEAVTPDDVFPVLTGETKAVQLVSKELQWDGSLFKIRKKTKRFLGIPFGKTVINIFGTSPGFWDGDVARHCAALMDPVLDPEKQMRPPFNPPLSSYLNRFQCRVLAGKAGSELIYDIGREWRENHGLTKKVINGRSVWHGS